MKKFEQTFRTT